MAISKGEYTLPLGLDANPVIQGLRQTKSGLVEVAEAAQQSNASMKATFEGLNNANKEATSSIVKTTSAITQQGKEQQTALNQFKGYYTLLQEIAAQNPKSFSSDTLKRYQEAMAQIYRYVGNIATANTEAFDPAKIKALDSSLKNATGDLNQFKTILQFIKENLGDLNLSIGAQKQLGGTIDTVSGLLNQQPDEKAPAPVIPPESIDVPTQKIVSLKTQLRAMKAELGTMAQGSPEFIKLAAQAAEIEDRIGDINAQVRLLASDTSSTDALIQGAQGIVGAFVAAQGAVALFGDDNEELQQTMVKLTAAMSVLQGVQQIGQLIDKNSALNVFLLKTLRLQQAEASVATAVAETAQAGATVALAAAEEGATAATWSLNAAMLANPAGVVLIAIGALVAAIAYFASSSEDAAEEQKKVAEAMKEAQNNANELAKAYTKVYSDAAINAEKAVSLAQAQGKSEGEIYVLKQKVLSARKQEGLSILANLGLTKQDISYNETLLQVRQEQLQVMLNQAVANGELSKDDQKKVEALKAQIDGIKTTLNAAKEAQKQIDDAEAESKNNAAARQRQLYLDSLKSATALAEAKAGLAEKGSRQELNIQIQAIEAARKQALADVNLTEGERFKIKADALKKIDDLNRQFRVNAINNEIEGQNILLNSAKEGSREELNAKLEILKLQADTELEQEGITDNKILAIRSKLEKDSAELRKKYNADVRISAANAQIDDLNASLTLVKEHSAAELEIKKQLIDQQRLIDVENAQQSIKSEAELDAKLKQIDAQATKSKQDLDKQYLKSYFDNNREILISEINLQNAILKAKMDNPLATDEEIFKAQQQIRQNELDSISGQLDDLDFLYDIGVVNEDEYQKKLNDLMAQGIAKRAELAKAEVENIKKFNLGATIIKSLGLNPKDPAVQQFINGFTGAISGAYSNLTQLFESQAQAQISAIQRVIDALNDQIKEQESKVNEQRKLSEKGLSNDLKNEEAKLMDFKKKQQEQVTAKEAAQKKLEEIRKQEAIIQSASIISGNIETGVNMINAMSKIFKAHAGIPFVGIALAVGFGALMLSSFLAIKNAISAATSDTPKFRKGGGFLIDGPSHENGGVGLYSKGKKIAEYEGKEYLFAVNKGSSQKYLPLLEAINADNKAAILKEVLGGTRLPDASVNDTINTQREVDDLKAKYAFSFDNPHLGSIDDRLRLLERIDDKLTPGKTVTDYGDYVIEQDGSITRKIWKRR
ncbi:MAG: hypothetical protein GXC72_00860 [Chitinophagaceae bacterium]|nr:hypothetical protein [Chitinophagaceae bacterium]